MVRLTFLPPVDFAKIVLDLRRTGMSGKHICASTGLTRGAIGEYCVGRSHPSHVRGEQLIALWCARTGSTRAEIPRLSDRALSAAKVAREVRGPFGKLAAANSAHAARDLFAVTQAWGARPPAL